MYLLRGDRDEEGKSEIYEMVLICADLQSEEEILPQMLLR